MCVCREWHAAASAVIREWPVLKISTFKNECSEEDYNTVLVDDSKSDKAIICSLMRIHHLNSIQTQGLQFVQDMSFNFTYKTSTRQPTSSLDRLVMQNASSLRQLAYPTLPLDTGSSYPMLQRLHVWAWDRRVIDIDDAWAPLFSRNISKNCATMLQHLQSPEIMLSINVDNVELHCLEHVIQTVVQMKQLEQLTFRFDFFSEPTSPTIFQLFSAFRHLKCFRLDRLAYQRSSKLGEYIGILVKQNTGLEDIDITGGVMTDQVLHHLSTLRHLESLYLHPHEGVFTEEALCDLLNGRSRTCLVDVSINRFTNYVSEQEQQRLSQEIEQMAPETGRRLCRHPMTDSRFSFKLTPLKAL